MKFTTGLTVLSIVSGSFAQRCFGNTCPGGAGSSGPKSLDCRGSNWDNKYCCVNGVFSGPVIDAHSSAIDSLQSSLSAVLGTRTFVNDDVFQKRAASTVTVEMSSGLTCIGVAAVTLTDPSASAQLASATSAAGDGGITSSENTGTTTVSQINGGSTIAKSTASDASAQSSHAGTSSSTGGGALITQAPVMVLGAAAAFVYGVM